MNPNVRRHRRNLRPRPTRSVERPPLCFIEDAYIAGTNIVALKWRTLPTWGGSGTLDISSWCSIDQGGTPVGDLSISDFQITVIDRLWVLQCDEAWTPAAGDVITLATTAIAVGVGLVDTRGGIWNELQAIILREP